MSDEVVLEGYCGGVSTKGGVPYRVDGPVADPATAGASFSQDRFARVGLEGKHQFLVLERAQMSHTALIMDKNEGNGWPSRQDSLIRVSVF